MTKPRTKMTTHARAKLAARSRWGKTPRPSTLIRVSLPAHAALATIPIPERVPLASAAILDAVAKRAKITPQA